MVKMHFFPVSFSPERLSRAPSGERLHLPLDEHLLDSAAEHAPLARHALRDPRARGRATRGMARRGKYFFSFRSYIGTYANASVVVVVMKSISEKT